MIHLFDTASGHELRRWDGHEDWTSALCFFRDRRLASFGRDSKFKIWDLPGAVLKDSVPALEGTELLKMVRFGDTCLALQIENDSGVALRNVQNAQLHFGFALYKASRHTICLSSDAQRLAVASRIDLHVTDVSSGKTIRKFDVPERLRNPNFHFSSSKGLSSVCFSPDHEWVAISDVNTIDVWNLASGRHSQLQPPELCAQAIQFSPDGRTLIMSGYGKTLAWNPHEKSPATRFVDTTKTHAAWNIEIEHSPCGKLFALGQCSTVKVFDSATMKMGWEASLDQYGYDTFALAFSPDSSQLAVGRATTLTIF